MQQIRDYVDVMFKSLPQTQEVLSIKANILDSMETKYEQYRQEGMDEATAIGRVIGEFGSIDDLKEALNLEEPAVDAFDSRTVETYLNYIPKFATAVAGGVSTIIAGTALFPLFEYLHLEIIGYVVFLTAVIIGVSLFIVYGLRLASIEIIGSELTPQDRDRVNAFKEPYKKKMIIAIPSGIALILLGVLIAVVMEELGIKDDISGVALLLFVALGVFFLISVPIKAEMPSRFLNPENHGDTMHTTAQEKKFGKITGALMGLTAMVYVGIGIVNRDFFAIGWIMFPIVALLMTLLEAIFTKAE
ncbi:permease prefix domain 1-containing protein [Erysipelothrix anatis]|uniref:permease prefix domain 1-containing protein n=1 Tax=Erysipelothrix anatis TaxID=2683713 RepID=UPI00135CBFD6|nr:permease prefix domain 1-containing protein [Erysipelothrix anatis]